MMADGAKTCSCGRGHLSFGQCLREKRINLGHLGVDHTNRNFDKQLQFYRDARRQGVQPSGVNVSQVAAAIRESDRRGEPFRDNAE